MRVLVCGGRDYTDACRVYAELSQLYCDDGPITCIIQGGALGADRFAKDWAIRNRVPVETYSAEWGKYGKRAGPIRNAKMLRWGQPNLVLAFPGGTGTADMVAKAEMAGVTVKQIEG